MTKRKLGIVLMLLAGLTLPISPFVDSWRVYEGKDKTMWGTTSYELTFGLRHVKERVCNKKKECHTRKVALSWKLARTTSAKAYYIFSQVTFYGSLLASLLLLLGAYLLWIRNYYGHTLMNLSLAATLLVLFAAYFSAMDPGISSPIPLHRKYGLGFGFSYILFTISCTLSIVGVRRVWRGTVEEEDREWFGDEGDEQPAAE